MRASELDKMFELEDTYWWFVARRQLVFALLSRHLPCWGSAPGPTSEAAKGRRDERVILDVGCGTGATLGGLSRFGLVVGVDSSVHALGYCQRRGHRELVQARGETLPIADESVDVVTALDLLEHISDDAAAVREFARVLRPGGLLIVTVPACPMLWSEHDEALDHLRRYRAARLRRIIGGSRMVIERLSPLISALLMPIAVLRFLQRLRLKRRGPQTALIIPPKSVNSLLTRLLRLENRWLLRRNLPVGVSLMAVARKAQRGVG